MSDAPPVLSPVTRLGSVSLTVADLPRMRDFYVDALGLVAGDRDDGSVALAAADGAPLVVLHEDREAPARDPRAPGLFHLAILLPSREDLGASLARLARGRRTLSGASDHLVSEALYLSDPEGNGIELYRDRPRDEWPRDTDGSPRMDTLALDLHDLLAAAGPDDGDAATPAGSRIGHVHLQVSDIPRAEAFYAGMLGFTPTVRAYPGALFVSAGGYHHHLGLNTWNSAGSPPPTPGSAGLRDFEVVLGDPDELTRVVDRLRSAGAEVDSRCDGATALVRDPFATTVALRAG